MQDEETIIRIANRVSQLRIDILKEEGLQPDIALAIGSAFLAESELLYRSVLGTKNTAMLLYQAADDNSTREEDEII